MREPAAPRGPMEGRREESKPGKLLDEEKRGKKKLPSSDLNIIHPWFRHRSGREREQHG